MQFATGQGSKLVALAAVVRGGAPPSLHSLLPVLRRLRCCCRRLLPRLWWDAGSGTVWRNLTGSTRCSPEEAAASCRPPPRFGVDAASPPASFSSGDDNGRPGGRTTREGDSGAEGGLVTSLPTIRPLGWMRCRHDARMGTSSSFGVGVPYGASNVVPCSARGDMMYGTAGSLLR